MNYIDIPRAIEDEFTKNSVSVKNSLQNILCTEIGTLPGNPEFGVKLDKFLFSLINPLTVGMIKEEIKYSLIKWEPRIDVKSIDVSENSDYNRLSIRIVFYIKNDVNNTELEYIYTKNK